MAASVALDENCFAEISPDDVLEGTYDPSCAPFTVTVQATGSNYVDGSLLGQTVTVVVTSATGNSCWGSLLVYDEWNPVIQCQPATINCFDDPNSVAAPVATDNCDPNPDLSFTESTQDMGCNGAIITRTYTATDDSGNTSSCDQVITVTRPSLNQVAFPQDLDDLQLPALDCVNPNTSPANTGYPSIAGFSLSAPTCDFAAEKEDQIIAICENSYKILREWTVFDWCTSQTVVHTQIIKVADDTAPVITCPGAFTISTQQNDCFASFGIPIPSVSDNCSSNFNIDVQVSTSAGTIVGNAVFNVPLGQHTLTYTATDDCGNVGTCTVSVTVEDQVAPVVVCETNHVVALNSPSGITLVQAIVFDDGSEDNCSDLTYEARRMDAPHCPGNDGTNFDNYVPFYCCDIGNSVMVELRVTDAAGNSNSCMVEATVQDELNPIITCPPPVTLDCNDDLNDLSLTGEPTVSDNCDATVTYNDNGSTDVCGGGSINRIWTATDGSGNSASCVQVITFENSSPFFITDTECDNPNPNDGVIWPCDFDTDACGSGLDPSVTGEPQIFEDFCDLVAVTYEDTYLPITAPACVKILRNWLVVDWCQFDEDNPSAGGSWEYVQVIKVLNSDDPVISSTCNDEEFCSYDENCATGEANLTLEATDDCTAAEDLNYSYVIDAFNDGSDDTFGSTNDASGTYPLGTHKISWTVEDGCGNISECDYLFTIKDCKKPTPYAFNGLAIEIMPVQQSVELWAVDFDAGSFDNCGIAEFRIASPSGGPGQTTPPPFPSSSVTFTCADIGTNTVDLWVRDVNNNWDYVSTYVIVQDNMNACNEPSDNINISGTVETDYAAPVDEVLMYSLPGNGAGIPDIGYYTDENGAYSFNVSTELSNLAIAPERNTNYLEGVSTFDLVLISQHILGIQALDSPYKIIAADINNSGTVSTLDIVDARRVILHIDEEFPNNTSWRFVDAAFVFPNTGNPFATSFPEIYSVNGLDSDVIADFIGIKVGDVNQTFNLAGNADDRQNYELKLKITDRELQANEEITVYLRSEEAQAILGYQFTLEFDPQQLSFIAVQTADIPSISNDHFGLQTVQEGYLTTSWNQSQAHQLASDEALFGITFKANQATRLSEVIRLSSRLTNAEAYNADLTILDLSLEFHKEDNHDVILAQSQPNPFGVETTINIFSPEAMSSDLHLYDINGRLIRSWALDLPAGNFQWTITKEDLPGAGVYYYQLASPKQKITKKLVHVRSKE